MVGLVIVLSLIVAYFVTTIEFTNAFGQSEEETIRLYSIPTPEEGADVDEVKEQWLIAFSILLNEANSNTNN
jgi:hypothetical protein